MSGSSKTKPRRQAGEKGGVVSTTRLSYANAERQSAFEKAREVPIPAVVRDFAGIELRRSGRNYVGLCPFHQERTPSFTVTPEKQMFYCFGCGAGGDGIAFVARLRGLRPLEAAKLICRHFGLVVADDPADLARLRREAAAQRRRLEALNAAWREAWITATAFYRAAAKANEAANYADPFFGAAEVYAAELLDRLESPDAAVRLGAVKEVVG